MAKTISAITTSSVYYSSATDNPLTIANSGAILVGGGNTALTLAAGIEWSVVNYGMISAAGGYGVHAATATIENQGTISGGYKYGLRLDGNTTLADSVVVNSGTILGARSGLEPFFYAAVDLNGAGEITNQSGGLISGANSGVMFDAKGTLSDEVANSGTIRGAAFYGVSSAGELTLGNSGLITGGAAGVVSAYYGGGPQSTGGNVVTNLAGGVIDGGKYGVSLAGSSTLTNAGTIGGTTAAVKFYPGTAQRLIDEPGAVFNGKVNGGNAIGSGALSTLELAAGSGAGTLTGFGVATGFYNFARVTVDAGASWALAGSNTLAAGVTLRDSGSLFLANAVSGAGTIAFAGTGLILQAAAGAAPHVTLSGLVGNEFVLDGFTETSFNVANGALTLDSSGGNVTLALAGSYTSNPIKVVSTGGNTYVTGCFATGTRIATASGPVPVEALRVGDRLHTLSGRLAPVVWIGHREVDLARHPVPAEAMPIRVAAGALGPDVPSRDLLLSPDHALFVDGVLVPVRYLVNDTTIVPAPREAVTYWHVELDQHDVILAEGAPCESYLDTGNRGAFAGHDAPPADTLTALSVWRRRACAPLVVSGARLDAIAERLRGREADCGWTATADPDLVLELAGETLRPRDEDGMLVFDLPGTRADAVLRSRQARRPRSEVRRLGLAVREMRRDGERLDRAALGPGWHAPEAELRWTDGEAVVPLAGARRLTLALWKGARYALRA